jgi:hypothetical protein
MEDENLIFKKVDELVALRTSIIHVLIVLVSGTLGLLFVHNSVLKFVLIPVGFYYACVLALNLDSIAKQISEILPFRKGGGK